VIEYFTIMLKGDFSMSKALSDDLRFRLIRNVRAGLSARAAGRKLDTRKKLALIDGL
jgi:hypothetical protein